MVSEEPGTTTDGGAEQEGDVSNDAASTSGPASYERPNSATSVDMPALPKLSARAKEGADSSSVSNERLRELQQSMESLRIASAHSAGLTAQALEASRSRTRLLHEWMEQFDARRVLTIPHQDQAQTSSQTESEIEATPQQESFTSVQQPSTLDLNTPSHSFTFGQQQSTLDLNTPSHSSESRASEEVKIDRAS